MTIDQGISLAASIGACLSAIAAFVAVRFSSNNTKASYKPELVIARTSFRSKTYGAILGEWFNEKENQDEVGNQMMFSVPLRNVGLGAAKEVTINWSFPIEDLVSTINGLAQKLHITSYFNYDNGTLFLKSEASGDHVSIWANQQKQTVDFVLPAPVDQVPYNLALPLAYTQLISALIICSAKSETFDSFPDIPCLTAEFSYLDIGGSKHSSKFVIQSNISMILKNGEEFQGCVESKNA